MAEELFELGHWDSTQVESDPPSASYETDLNQ